jgi:hypothetical protein
MEQQYAEDERCAESDRRLQKWSGHGLSYGQGTVTVTLVVASKTLHYEKSGKPAAKKRVSGSRQIRRQRQELTAGLIRSCTGTFKIFIQYYLSISSCSQTEAAGSSGW